MGDPGEIGEAARLFRSDALERLTVFSMRSFAVMWGFLLPMIAWAGWGEASAFEAAVLTASGLLFWSIFEYGMHRHVFHLEWEPAQWFVHLFHGNHHDVPNDPLRNLMPPAVSLPIAGVAWGLCLAWLGTSGTWFFLGFISGYVAYDAVHYACHQMPMRGRVAMAFKRHHMRHHHSGIPGNYGVSAPIWDRVFRTRIISLRKSKPPEG